MNILILDDHLIFSTGLDLLFRSVKTDYKGICMTSISDVMQAPKSTFYPLNLILMDLYLNNQPWKVNFKQMRKAFPNVPIAIISSCDNPQTVDESIQQGAQGYIPKSTPPEQILTAISSMLDGEIFIPHESFLSNNTHHENPSSADETYGLSIRQQEILCLILQGKAIKVIAFELGLSESTVKSHLSFIYKCLNVKNKAQAIRFCQNKQLFL